MGGQEKEKGRDGDIESGRGCLLPWVHGLGQPAGAVGMQLGTLSLCPHGSLCAYCLPSESRGRRERGVYVCVCVNVVCVRACVRVCVCGCCLIKNANTATP